MIDFPNLLRLTVIDAFNNYREITGRETVSGSTIDKLAEIVVKIFGDGNGKWLHPTEAQLNKWYLCDTGGKAINPDGSEMIVPPITAIFKGKDKWLEMTTFDMWETGDFLQILPLPIPPFHPNR